MPTTKRPNASPDLLGTSALVFLAAHVVLALFIKLLPAFATLHAFATVAAVLVVAATQSAPRIAAAVAYVSGCEVLWRMARVPVDQLGKYTVILICLVALFRVRTRKNWAPAMVYFLLLLPSTLMTLSDRSLEAAREGIAANLSGPLSLALCIMLFSNIKLPDVDLRRVYVALMGGALSIAVLAVISTAAAKEIEFGKGSTGVTSGGFGPNQVSAILGLGLMFCVLMLFERRPLRSRIPLMVLALVYAVQAALTFSRGGLFLALGALALALTYLVRNSRTRRTLVITLTLFTLVAKFVVIPRLQDFTQGHFGERYTSADPTGRALLAGFDLQIFADHPLLGVGPGAASVIRGEMGHFGAAHTEYTRMLAEHGLFGLTSLIILLVISYRTFRRASTLQARALTGAMLAWFLMYLLINSTRLSAPAVMLGLACSIAHGSRRADPSKVRTKAPARGMPRPVQTFTKTGETVPSTVG